MPNRKPRFFLLTRYDDDTKKFNTIGPITGEEEQMIIKTTNALRKHGRKVRISASPQQTDISKVPSAEEYNRKQLVGYTYDPDLLW